ncbi:multicopper oxidase family protein [Aromatoleum diolicum]|uniref:Multicopper oxidase domain-containing protein n=1 Tax=Aromatoleum diolicum TaxID=75796 RepID=A0ABX1QBG1_9RHOO|nr:multicopper oxidase family protein [Aromatoleum diolicum]NMG75728.1 multicopper oxidase domain-containing protein [Aromatoleum diolicum]
MNMSRREFIKSAAVSAGGLAMMPGMVFAAPARAMTLRAAPFEQAVRTGGPRTNFWGFNGGVPGPVLKFRKGESVRLVVQNALDVDSAVHWHGVRVPNAMDGVPHVTQNPIRPGDEFVYEFALPDSGTFWYHPHQSSFEQVPRGLYGALIVEEDEPIEVDRELVWVLSDVRIGDDGRQTEDFGRILDVANDGRIGNQVLLNGKAAGAELAIDVRRGERIRLRLINAAAARIFQLGLAGHAINVIAFDGQAVEPHVVENLQLGPGMRADLVIDCMQVPGGRYLLTDSHRRNAGPLATLIYSDARPLRDKPLSAPIRLAPNQLPEPDLAKATEHYIMFQGGMRGVPVIGLVDGKPAKTHELMERHGLAWTMNYTARHEHSLMHEPFLHLNLGEHVVLRMINETDFVHPMHLHGHFFRVIAVNGKKVTPQPWHDTVIMGPRQSVDVAFVADNAGDWMYHCHILDHAAGGMMGTIRVG